ncbi:MAG: Jag N-terminal domain-containing protein, partial [Clostridia bacterium]|nr:Jag N-terminal domain-containing protein [Clostridia bacterium]
MEFTGKTVEEAVEQGLKELGITEEQAEIKVIEEPVKGLFGKIKKEAVVSVTEKVAEKPVKQAKTVSGNANGTEAAAEFLREIFKILDTDAEVEITGENSLSVISNDSSQVIGYRGEVLDALQVLAGAVANIGNKDVVTKANTKYPVTIEGNRHAPFNLILGNG